jgi:hypothetical protein
MRTEEKLSLAKALRKERQSGHEAIALHLSTGYSASRESYTRRFLAYPITESCPMIMTSPLNGGAGLAGKSGRKTANTCDTNASEMSADTTAHFIFVARNNFTAVSHILVQ